MLMFICVCDSTNDFMSAIRDAKKLHATKCSHELNTSYHLLRLENEPTTLGLAVELTADQLSNMSIKVLPAEDADMRRIFSIASDAFNVNEPLWDAMYPSHPESSGRDAGGERFLKIKNSDPNTTFIKAVDTSSGEIVGFAKWNVYANNTFPDSSSIKGHESIYWAERPDEEPFSRHCMEVFVVDRNAAIKASGGNLVSLDILTVDSNHQRRGVGQAMVEWGTQKADALGVEAVVESSAFGKGLYEKNGFDFVKDVELEMPEQWKDRPKMRTAWMVRPAKGKA